MLPPAFPELEKAFLSSPQHERIMTVTRLLKLSTAPQIHLYQLVCKHLTTERTTNLDGLQSEELLEEEVNDFEKLSSLCQSGGEQALESLADQLANMIPFLHVDNEKCASICVEFVKSCLSPNLSPLLSAPNNVNTRVNSVRALITTMLVHPAFSQEQKQQLEQHLERLKSLDLRFSFQSGGSAPSTPQFTSAAPLPSGLGSVPESPQFAQFPQKTTFAVPPVPREIKMHGKSRSHDGDGGSLVHGPPLSVVTRRQSTSEDIDMGRSALSTPESPLEGGNPIAFWLRSLRLHKYTEVLQHLNLAALANVGDADLQALGVTAQGARRKLLLAIKCNVNLMQRVSPLGKDMVSSQRFLTAVEALREVLATYRDQLATCGILPEFTDQFTATLCKGFCHICVSEPNQHHLMALLSLLQDAILASCFPRKDQATFFAWKDELERLAARQGWDPRDYIDLLDDSELGQPGHLILRHRRQRRNRTRRSQSESSAKVPAHLMNLATSGPPTSSSASPSPPSPSSPTHAEYMATFGGASPPAHHRQMPPPALMRSSYSLHSDLSSLSMSQQPPPAAIHRKASLDEQHLLSSSYSLFNKPSGISPRDVGTSINPLGFSTWAYPLGGSTTGATSAPAPGFHSASSSTSSTAPMSPTTPSPSPHSLFSGGSTAPLAQLAAQSSGPLPPVGKRPSLSGPSSVPIGSRSGPPGFSGPPAGTPSTQMGSQEDGKEDQNRAWKRRMDEIRKESSTTPS